MRRLSLVVVATFVVAIVGTVGIAGPTEAAEKLTAAQEEKVLDGLRKKLKDPNSAILGQIKAGTEEGGTINVCGFVNAKNSFGGYTGDTPFFGVLLSPPTDTFVVFSIGDTEPDLFAIDSMCKRHGLGLW